MLNQSAQPLTGEQQMDLPQAIQKQLDRLDEERNQVLALLDIARMAHAVADVFPDMGFSVSIAKWHFKPFVTMMVDVVKFDDLIPVLRDLASRGWHTDKGQPFSDYLELERRTYNLLGPGESAEVVDTVSGERKYNEWYEHKLRIMAFPRKDGALCKRVRVGTKEEPVFKFVCEGDAA
jgi:hypothetical protein